MWTYNSMTLCCITFEHNHHMDPTRSRTGNWWKKILFSQTSTLNPGQIMNDWIVSFLSQLYHPHSLPLSFQKAFRITSSEAHALHCAISLHHFVRSSLICMDVVAWLNNMYNKRLLRSGDTQQSLHTLHDLHRSLPSYLSLGLNGLQHYLCNSITILS